MSQKHLVVIGNGMAGMACVDQILQHENDFIITVLSEEPHYNYNRILLSSVLAKEKTLDDIYINTKEWYEKNNINLLLSSKAVDVDSKEKWVRTEDGKKIPYDILLLATGSDPFIPPIQDVEKHGVYTFRNIGDTKKIIEHSKSAKKALVIGGGLLGLEAARGIKENGPSVSVVHRSDVLMNMQLDSTGGKFLKREIEKLGIDVHLKKNTKKVLGNGHVTGLEFEDGNKLDADMVVIACGIKPNIGLAKKAGLEVNRGVIVNDFMETNLSDVFAVGECIEHRGVTYGLVAPLFEQGKVLAATITGHKGPTYEGTTMATKLKVMGIEVFSAGDFKGDGESTDVVVFEDNLKGIYKKVLLKEKKPIGTILIGDAGEANRFLEKIRKGDEWKGKSHNLLFDDPHDGPGTADDVMSKPDSETVCGCIGVSKGQIITAIKSNKCQSVNDIKKCTKATSGCGTCAGLVGNILKNVIGAENVQEKKNIVCECVPFPKEQLRRIIQTQKLKTVKDVLDIYGNSEGCFKCKPALAYIVDEVHMGDHIEDRSARFINDRVHANIQKDGTFSVVPRMKGGVTTPDELRKIADAAEKYNAKMVKVTGSQRIDLLGVKKSDLPKMWKDLGMRSGHAYAKAVRMVKSCVGADFCRFGTQNSIQAGIDLETKLEGLYTPAKVKMAVVGCPRNCAEATVKDIGLVGIEGGWQVVVGGAAGKTVRPADILSTVVTQEDAFRDAFLFFQYYRENGEYLERTYDFIERVGIEKVRQETTLAPESVKKGLLDRLDKAKTKTCDPWEKEAKKPVHPMQFKDFVLPIDKDALKV